MDERLARSPVAPLTQIRALLERGRADDPGDALLEQLSTIGRPLADAQAGPPDEPLAEKLAWVEIAAGAARRKRG